MTAQSASAVWCERAARIVAGAWIAVIGATLALGAFASARWRDGLAEHGPGCVFRTVTGVPCPFCGMTHATLALGHGDVGAALGDHPAVFVVLAGMLVVCGHVVAGDRILTRRHAAIGAGVIVACWIAKLCL